ncbi:MAG: hypothetical protein ACFFE8_07645 [Candidatus Heimdallarchaeota archaeon]
MIDWVYFVEISWISILGLFFPIFGFTYKLSRSNQRLAIDRVTGAKYVILSGIFSITLFFILVFFTGGIIQVFYQEIGLFLEPQAVIWNVTQNLAIIIPYQTGTGFIAVAILSGLTYAGLLIFPPVCKVDSDDRTAGLQAATNSASTIIAGSSALASGVACCSTSLISILSPAFSALLAPFASSLVILSIFLLNFNLFRQIFPRYPVKSNI